MKTGTSLVSILLIIGGIAGIVAWPLVQPEAESKLNLLFELGSQVNLQFVRGMEDLVFGVNLVALAAFMYLMKASKEMAVLGASAGSP